MPPDTGRLRSSPYLGTRKSNQLEIATDAAAAQSQRLTTLDLARGFAIALMIFSHGVKGLVSFEDFPTWGLVPLHLVTKFSSSLFILIFGISLAVAFLPHVNTPTWGAKRRQLLIRGLVVLFWYKVLTIVEMFHNSKPEEILQALTYQNFPSYVEILGFYGIALLWVPYALSLWKVLPIYVRLFVPLGFIALTSYLTNNAAEIFATPQLQALLVEHDDYYTWGQISRAPLIFAGLLLGEAIAFRRAGGRLPLPDIPKLINYTGAAALVGFFLVAWGDWGNALHLIALNKGKHPPEMAFMLFSLGGALLILGTCLRAGKEWSATLSPITLLGKGSLNAFIFHAFVLFVFYRFLFDFWLKVSYEKALLLAIALIALSAVWVKTLEWVGRR